MIPYLQQLQDSISQQKELLKFLELKEKFLLNKIAEKESELTEYYRNDDLEYIDSKISSIKIKNEISSLKKIIDEKESYFKKYAAEFEKDWEQVEKDFSTLFLKAKGSNNANVKDFFQKINYEMIEREPQTKVYVYKRLKALMKN
jgi:hypothetical protein